MRCEIEDIQQSYHHRDLLRIELVVFIQLHLLIFSIFN